jgi:hypothetical protein
MNKFLKKVVFFLSLGYLIYLGLTLLLIVLFKLDYPGFHPDKGNYHSEYKKSFTEGDIDIILLGSSRILNAIDPSTLSDELNLKTAHLGFTQSNMSYSYDLLKSYLHNSKHNLKYIILDISWFSFDSRRLSYKPYASYFVYKNPSLFLSYLFTNKKNHLKNGFLTLLRSFDRKNQHELDLKLIKSKTISYDTLVKSYDFNSNDLNFLRTFPEGKSELNEEEIESLENIISIANKNNINIVVLTTPEDEVFSLSQKNRSHVYSIINQYSSNFYWMDYTLNGKYYDKSYEYLLSDSHHIYFDKVFTKIFTKDLIEVYPELIKSD